jgi:hypothetical protein
MIRCSQVLVLLLLLSITAASPAGALNILPPITDKSVWDAGTSGDLFSEDFESFTADTSFSGAVLDGEDIPGPGDDALSFFSITQGGGLGTSFSSTDLIDVSPFGFSGAEDVNGTNYALGFVNATVATLDPLTYLNSANTVQLMFDTPLAGWGADFQASGVQFGLDFLVIPVGAAGDPTQWVFVDGANAFDTNFFGFIVDYFGVDGPGKMEGVVIIPGGPNSSGLGQRFGMDDVVGATIPEPATAALLALGLAGLGVAGRRR